MSSSDKIITPARQMREAITKRRRADVDQMLGEVQELFNKEDEYSVIYSIPQHFEHCVKRLVYSLKAEGYSVVVEESYYEDRPCGGYIPARLTISCEGAE